MVDRLPSQKQKKKGKKILCQTQWPLFHQAPLKIDYFEPLPPLQTSFPAIGFEAAFQIWAELSQLKPIKIKKFAPNRVQRPSVASHSPHICSCLRNNVSYQTKPKKLNVCAFVSNQTPNEISILSTSPSHNPPPIKSKPKNRKGLIPQGMHRWVLPSLWF